MKKKIGFTLVELLVVIAVIALLLSILMPALNKVKRQAQGVACRANLGQWGMIWNMYLSENNQCFPANRMNAGSAEGNAGKDLWVYKLRNLINDEDLLLCPSAMTEDSPRPFKAWDFTEAAQTPNTGWYNNYPYVVGSYGQNNWCISKMSLQWLNERNALPYFYADAKQKDSYAIPLFADCSWWQFRDVCYNTTVMPWEACELLNNLPPVVPQDGGGIMGMRCVALARHGIATNVLFLDFSTRNVPLKELWDLKWHRDWEKQKRDNPFSATIWPAWME